jgi:hypothetical protein
VNQAVDYSVMNDVVCVDECALMVVPLPTLFHTQLRQELHTTFIVLWFCIWISMAELMEFDPRTPAFHRLTAFLSVDEAFVEFQLFKLLSGPI